MTELLFLIFFDIPLKVSMSEHTCINYHLTTTNKNKVSNDHLQHDFKEIYADSEWLARGWCVCVWWGVGGVGGAGAMGNFLYMA